MRLWVTATAYLSSGRVYDTGMNCRVSFDTTANADAEMKASIVYATTTVIASMRKRGHDAREYRIELRFD